MSTNDKIDNLFKGQFSEYLSIKNKTTKGNLRIIVVCSDKIYKNVNNEI